jgi:hypothetical protein
MTNEVGFALQQGGNRRRILLRAALRSLLNSYWLY